ncbi:MAG: DUF1080 domain-containing protein [Planctomycetota bacterium]
MKSMFLRFIATRLLALLMLSGLLASPTLTCAQEPPQGFEKLFNGDDLDGWYATKTQDPRQFQKLSDQEQKDAIAAAEKETGKWWRVENGEIVNDGDGPFLTTKRNFRDYELLIEYKTVPRADSGVYLKGTPQVQIWDSTDEGKFKNGADKGSGGLWNNKHPHGKDPLVLADKPFGQWNKFRILQIGARTSVWLNDKQVVDHAIMDNYWGNNQRPLINSGPIQLQTHGGEIRWRNVYVRELDANEANKMLASKNNDGFESVFDGSSLAGWTGAVDNYEIVDGTIVCKKGKGGNLFTEKEYGNFVVRLMFQLPPAGNNGLAIRFPGQGNPAYDGMTELQVLDSEHKRYAILDARQYHGSAYGIAAAHRGYLRPTGEWNFQEVTVDGSKIRVELNGTVILDTDVSQVTSFKDDAKHPGLNREKGHFGFAGHNDPVKFKSVSIKPLDP